MHTALNARTQPMNQMPVFTNWDVVAKGWYIACSTASLGRGQALRIDLCGQRLVVFRGEDGRARALDAFCAHMGSDLSIGRVVGNTIRCSFHHWRWDGEGRCAEIPVGEPVPKRARLQSYATDERYGFVWVWPEAEAPSGVVEFEGWQGQPVVAVPGVPYERPCHHHVNMINGIDPQHLRTVHGFSIQMDLAVDESSNGRVVDYVLTGTIPRGTPRERVLRRMLGTEYRYSMRYADGNLGLLSILQGVRLFGRGPALEGTHMIYAFTPMGRGRTRIQPIYVARRHPGALARLRALAKLGTMRAAFQLLRDEDGLIYDTIRFNPNALLQMDAPVARYIAYVNRLEPSVWSPRLGPRKDNVHVLPAG